MLLTALYFALLGFIAFGLRAPFDRRRAVSSAVGGLVVGLIVAFFNAYPGSIRGALVLLGISFALNGLMVGRPMRPDSRPIWPQLPALGGALVVSLVVIGIFPYTAWGADSAEEPIYQDLQMNVRLDPAPALTRPEDVRVVPWDVASQLLKNGYAEDASFLSSDPLLLTRNTYPDTVKGEFLWVHAPAPETAKWLFGGRLTDKVVYVHNDASNQVPSVVDGTLNIHLDSIWWQHRVARFAENAGEFRWILKDAALQFDDDLHPYWIGYLARLDIKGQTHMEKLLVIDAYTGDERLVDVGDAPTELPWLEMVYPETYVYEWASYWGKHREGFFYRWFNASRLVTPDDVTVRYIRLENETYWLLPMRQLNSAQLGGYILIHTRTGEATFYDRFDKALIDYDTAVAQLTALMRSGEATEGGGAISLGISEGYLYPVKMGDGSVRDAYVFPLTEGLKIKSFAVIDAQDYTTKRVFKPSIGDALTEFAALTGGRTNSNVTLPNATLLPILDGTVTAQKAIVNVNGTLYRVTSTDLAAGTRQEAEREFDELAYAISRANRGETVELRILIQGGRIVDVIDPTVKWGT